MSTDFPGHSVRKPPEFPKVYPERIFMTALKIILCALFGYCVGGINPSYLIAKCRGFDIRRRGSGNAGASNALISMGSSVAVFSALFDILKATAVTMTAPLLFAGLPFAAEIGASACILGHIYPAYMQFRGGKGLACLGGAILAIDWRFFLIMLAAELVLALIVNYICVVPISASFVLPVTYGLLGSDGADVLRHAQGGWWGCGHSLGCLGRDPSPSPRKYPSDPSRKRTASELSLVQRQSDRAGTDRRRTGRQKRRRIIPFQRKKPAPFGCRLFKQEERRANARRSFFFPAGIRSRQST